MATDSVPIRNIYFLLCYAWNHLQEKKYARVRTENCDKIWDLLAKIMVRSSQQLVKRGLHRSYVLRHERRVRLKGKIQIAEDIKRPVFSSATRMCEFDELDSDVLPNQIIAATFAKLMRHPGLSEENRKGVREAFATFAHCSPLRIRNQDFRRLRLNGNMRHYRFILNVCELIHSQSLGTEESGSTRFRDFERDEATMGLLFERFVRTFYEKEQSQYRVSAPQVRWDLDIENSSGNGPGLLPSMQSDIFLASENDRWIIDCKFYRSLYQQNFDTRKFISGNLYQLFSYLRNQSVVPGWENARGMLLYPTTHEQVHEHVSIQGHEIHIASINLSQDWKGITHDLLNLISEPIPPAS